MTEPLFLIDANICIYLLETTSSSLRSRVERCAPGQVVTSAIAFAEVLVGSVRQDALGEALRFLSVIPALPFDEAAAHAYGRMSFRRAGFDRLIAAHALALGVTLVTNNESDFADVPGLRVENWTI